MPLNENEERILQEIEQRFLAHDPESANRLGSTTLPKYLARNCKWAALGFLAGLVVLLVGFASSWVVGVFGFAVMLGSAIVLDPQRAAHGPARLPAAELSRCGAATSTRPSTTPPAGFGAASAATTPEPVAPSDRGRQTGPPDSTAGHGGLGRSAGMDGRRPSARAAASAE